jgi:anti-sigma-K factor RskA
MKSREEMMELAALYAIDALEPDEQHIVEAALYHDGELRTEVDAYRGVAAILAESVESAPSTPSPDVWRLISAEIAGDTAERTPRLASVTDIRQYRRWTWLATAVSAAAVVVSMALGARVLNLQDQIGSASIEELASAAVTEPGSRLVSLAGAEGFEASSATVVLQADGIGYLLTDTLPAAPADRTYQLWAVVNEGDETRVVSAGVLGPDPGVSRFSSDGNVVAFAITEEVVGGVVVAEGPTVVVGEINA